MILDDNENELNSLIYSFLVDQKCFESAAFFFSDIGYKVNPAFVRNSTFRLEEIIEHFRFTCKKCTNVSIKSERKRKASNISIGNIDDSSSSEDFIDVSDSDESDVVYVKTDFQGVSLPSMKDIFGNSIERDVVTNRKRIDLELFREYKNHFGDLRVPKIFSVPYDDSWPEKFYGACLGKTVDAIRQSLKKGKLDYCEGELNELLEMGFIPDAHEDKYQRILLAFQVFIAKYGHCDVPRLFTIDKHDEGWPEELRGFNLGVILMNIRHYGKCAKIHQDLTDIGVDITSRAKTLTSEQIHSLLLMYKQLHGNVDVKPGFVVPESADYPEYAWGFDFGRCLRDIRNRGYHSSHREQWAALGLKLKTEVVKSSKSFSFDNICEAFEHYTAIYNKTSISNAFIVTSDSTFPSHLHGLRLGKIVYDMRNAGTYGQHKERLLKLGIVVGKHFSKPTLI